MPDTEMLRSLDTAWKKLYGLQCVLAVLSQEVNSNFSSIANGYGYGQTNALVGAISHSATTAQEIVEAIESEIEQPIYQKLKQP
jgi:hypothetical protein